MMHVEYTIGNQSVKIMGRLCMGNERKSTPRPAPWSANDD